jgi:8-hydroxy-5-deazaflavin:NADPH oxidoreductase
VTIPRAKEIVAQLLDRIGFDSVDAGTIAESWRQQPGSPVYCINPTKEELQQRLKNVDRSSLVTNREKSSEAFYAVVDADYQTQVNAMRSVHNEIMNNK